MEEFQYLQCEHTGVGESKAFRFGIYSFHLESYPLSLHELILVKYNFFVENTQIRFTE